MTSLNSHLAQRISAPDAPARADVTTTQSTRRPLARRGHRSRGVAIIEFAFVFPFLLILFFSLIDFGIYFFDQHTLQFATRLLSCNASTSCRAAPLVAEIHGGALS